MPSQPSQQPDAIVPSTNVPLTTESLDDLPGPLQFWALGLTTVGGQFLGWNAAWVKGFLPFFASQKNINGGSYCLTRAVLGFYPGFVLACLEIVQGAVSIFYVGNFLTTAFAWSPNWQPLILLILYASSSALLHIRAKFVFELVLVFAILGTLVPALANAVAVDPTTNATRWSLGPLPTSELGMLPLTTYAYTGVESLAVVTGFAHDPRYAIPRGSVWAVWTLFLFNLAFLVVVAAFPPGISSSVHDTYVLNTGFRLGVGLSVTAAQWLILPSQMGMALGFMIAYARLTQAFADLHLLPSFLRLHGHCTTVHATVDSPAFGATHPNISILAATVVYAGLTYGFVLLRTTYKVETMPHGYTSSYGVAGAYFVWTVYAILAFSVVGRFQSDSGLAVGCLDVLVLVLSVY
ncbi:Aste57867_11866 [Aphanomyces stellatus]|uniref:Aste57867_11866 protein n=1 Tax=Aphanomyces stellatus TaxID=120398 RepID=A0A485KUJ0_9STRA|nr:hypothetical protein As57867_011821 [Aphanomyces stellatus]VFT88721.1 Aste57867_11866 [Aphanomyces stellatus]